MQGRGLVFDPQKGASPPSPPFLLPMCAYPAYSDSPIRFPDRGAKNLKEKECTRCKLVQKRNYSLSLFHRSSTYNKIMIVVVTFSPPGAEVGRSLLATQSSALAARKARGMR